ncbi:MAG TPA: hypothetical protein VM802_27615 [Chitinophaga sp.]|uniref:hypothetical protein n=1 Tax=Chitinophaga sp. TaxID=1869181 RepID=UPI002B742A4D|nr:hypothetical protein [Chitinophaga sp.]HVI48668.1 hypothetical protein [Chitinophaga sp.]
MKQVVLALATTVVFFSCRSNPDQAAIQAAKQATIDSMNNINLVKQQVVDSMNALNHKKGRHGSSAGEYVTPHYSDANYSDNSGAAPATAAAPAPAPAPAPRKKGFKNWSHTAKGAVVGAGAGAITGALVNKNHAAGAVIGTLIGAGVGAGTGAIVDHEKKKRQARAGQ